MPYAAQSDLLTVLTREQLVQLTDDEREGAVNSTVVNGVLADASAQVDSYCRTRYQVPLQPSQDAVRITRDISVWLLFSRRVQKVPEGVEARYAAAMKLLTDVSKGAASLDQQAGSPTPQVSLAGPVIPQCKDERFTERNMEGFV